MKKSTVEEIRQRFDADVERFANLETGQSATVDAPLAMDLIVRVAAAVTPAAMHVLDIGCGAGNYTLKLLELLPELNVTLVDLSRPMLDRALQRISAATTANVITIQADIRKVRLGEERFDIILAAAVFHHLRTDAEWHDVFAKCYTALRPGGSLWISDLIEHSHPAIQALMWERYGDIPGRAEGRGVPRSCLRLHRERRHPAAAAVPDRPAAQRRVQRGRNPAQE